MIESIINKSKSTIHNYIYRLVKNQDAEQFVKLGAKYEEVLYTFDV